jgi:adenine phosphoribosyltransferase
LLAGAKLLQRLGANVVEAAAIVDLPSLGGGDRIRASGLDLYAVCAFPD